MGNPKFERTVTLQRTMTPDEARAKCAEMGLSEELTAYIVGEFERVHEPVPDDHDDECSCQAHVNNECERYVRDDGKIGWSQEWETAWEDLAKKMGVPEDDAWDAVGDEEGYPEVARVWNAFFEE